MQQYMINEEIVIGKTIQFDREQSHHIADVMRMKTGEIVRLVFPLEKQAGFARIEYDQKQVIAKIESLDEVRHELPCAITLCVGILKKEKWEYLIQKVTELGVVRIVPFESQRTVVKSKEEKQDKKIERWEKIALEAAEQSKRECLPEIFPCIRFKEIVNYQSELNCIAYEDASHSGESLRKLVENQPSMTIVIGPEGGFSKEEVEFLEKEKFRCISLGKRILRAETAAAHSVSIVAGLVE